MNIEKGDIVLRKSYGKDIYFKVISIEPKTSIAILKGLDIRLCADAPLSDLEKPGIGELASYRARSIKMRVELVSRANRRQNRVGHGHGEKHQKKQAHEYVEIPGRILHLDGDSDYLGICKKAYDDMEIVNHCYHVPEEMQPLRIESLLRENKPDILVLTGHDGMIKKEITEDGVNNYHTSRYFIDAVTKARIYQSSKDELVIFAGACQSWYQGLIEAGANFASSPARVLIHCLDPVLIVEKVAYTSICKTISIYDTLVESITGIKGVGGIESRGQFRLGLPKTKK